MERYSKGRVILCGDAVRSGACKSKGISDVLTNNLQAHAMTPFDGGGAAQAIEVSAMIRAHNFSFFTSDVLFVHN